MIGKMLTGLMNFDFCCRIQMTGSEVSVNNMLKWIHPVLYPWVRLMMV